MSRLFKYSVLALSTFVFAGCAAKVTLIDRKDGQVYYGSTDGSTMGGSGTATITIEGIKYSGPWVYQATGGSFGFSNFQTTTNVSASATSFGSNVGSMNTSINGVGNTSGQSMLLLQSASGNGMINARSDSGMFIRCVFTFNTLNNTGLGQCLRNDERIYDVQLKR